MLPDWYGKRYPLFSDLLIFCESLGALVGEAAIGAEALYVAPDLERKEPAVILLPSGCGPLRSCWLLAHELGHLMQHAGPRGHLLYGKDERAANHWAARALIPEALIQYHQNASLDAFIGALSRHYEDIPAEDCPLRDLAAEIARQRLNVHLEARFPAMATQSQDVSWPPSDWR
jgi:Zn-dependent peptidase ImmA (M78 family)